MVIIGWHDMPPIMHIMHDREERGIINKHFEIANEIGQQW